MTTCQKHVGRDVDRPAKESRSDTLWAGQLLCVGLLMPFFAQSAAADETVDQLLIRARAAYLEQEPDRAMALATQAIDAAPDNARGYALRGDLYASTGQHDKAVADYGAAIKVAPELAELFDRRGSEQFKLGHVEESIADFDRYLSLRPNRFRTTGSAAFRTTTRDGMQRGPGNSISIRRSTATTSKTQCGATCAWHETWASKRPGPTCWQSSPTRGR